MLEGAKKREDEGPAMAEVSYPWDKGAKDEELESARVSCSRVSNCERVQHAEVDYRPGLSDCEEWGCGLQERMHTGYGLSELCAMATLVGDSSRWQRSPSTPRSSKFRNANVVIFSSLQALFNSHIHTSCPTTAYEPSSPVQLPLSPSAPSAMLSTLTTRGGTILQFGGRLVIAMPSHD